VSFELGKLHLEVHDFVTASKTNSTDPPKTWYYFSHLDSCCKEMAGDSNGRVAEPGSKGMNGNVDVSKPKPAKAKKQKSFSPFSAISRYGFPIATTISGNNFLLGF
jgi:hypothetical protein